MEQKYERTFVQVDLDAISHNMDAMHRNLNPGVKMFAVIKTDGYGHGAVPIMKLLEEKDYVYGYAVATLEEGEILRRHGTRRPVLILGSSFESQYRQMVNEEICASVFRMDMARELSQTAVALNKPAHIHIKLDTGMNRIGFCPDEDSVRQICQISKLPGIVIDGLFTHFAKADETDKTHARMQMKTFFSFAERLAESGVDIPVLHCSNSAGIIDLPEANAHVVRAGIALYGLYPSDQVDRSKVKLQPALSWKSQVVHVKNVEPGNGISYGGTYIPEHTERIATIPVGYGDGYPRLLSNKGYVLIRGQKAPVRGRVCMDQFMVDVTHIPHVQIGDAVTLIGQDGDSCICVEELGDLCGRFNYEFVCDISKRVPRIYVRNGQVTETRDWFSE